MIFKIAGVLFTQIAIISHELSHFDNVQFAVNASKLIEIHKYRTQ
jgi:hypothetical protein